MSTAQKQLLIDNIVGAIKTVPRAIQDTKADPAYGEGVAKGLGLPTPQK